jgi:hypothetical protein
VKTFFPHVLSLPFASLGWDFLIYIIIHFHQWQKQFSLCSIHPVLHKDFPGCAGLFLNHLKMKYVMAVALSEAVKSVKQGVLHIRFEVYSSMNKGSPTPVLHYRQGKKWKSSTKAGDWKVHA